MSDSDPEPEAARPARRERPTAEGKALLRTKVADRRRQVGRLHLSRVPQRDIARKLGISQATVSADLKLLRADWRHEAKGTIAEASFRELAALDADEATFRAKMAATKEEDLQIRYYQLVLKIMERRARILGLDAPAKTQLSGPGGGPLEVQHAGLDLTQLFLADPSAAALGTELLERLDEAPPRGGDAPGPRAGAPGRAREARDAGRVEGAEAPRVDRPEAP
jgi:hypothetical protein